VPAVARLVTTAELAGTEPFSVRVLHEAELPDGRRVLLLADRGFTSSGPYDSPAEIEAEARTVVGPDEPFSERTSEDMAAGHWAALAERLRSQGVETTAAELRQAPHDVVLSERLRRQA